MWVLPSRLENGTFPRTPSCLHDVIDATIRLSPLNRHKVHHPTLWCNLAQARIVSACGSGAQVSGKEETPPKLIVHGHRTVQSGPGVSAPYIKMHGKNLTKFSYKALWLLELVFSGFVLLCAFSNITLTEWLKFLVRLSNYFFIKAFLITQMWLQSILKFLKPKDQNSLTLSLMQTIKLYYSKASNTKEWIWFSVLMAVEMTLFLNLCDLVGRGMVGRGDGQGERGQRWFFIARWDVVEGNYVL